MNNVTTLKEIKKKKLCNIQTQDLATKLPVTCMVAVGSLLTSLLYLMFSSSQWVKFSEILSVYSRTE